MKTYLILMISALAIMACDSDQKSGNHPARHEMSQAGHQHPKAKQLLDLHDSLMEKMEEILTLKKRLKSIVNRLDSLNGISPGPELQKRKQQAEALAEQLSQADESMMDWMHQYKTDTLEKLDAGRQDAYIADQTAKMNLVNSQTQNAMSKSNEFIKNNNQ
ncbi:hypothetical protein LXM25_02895 [Dyadobacter sp. LJ53]|uniref:hypothetical protein n=1 Tax=Dyadobacter chenwenxiniae TaxID=2906456 RepID=UPI001F3B4C2B|nr:hypothetical protein [Dyadobacter chenwenxiniae]MCF0048988.1 hypothetical protein [Dyadobacter chenwenxiniae]